MEPGRCAIEGCPEPVREGTSSCARHAAFETALQPMAWGRTVALSFAGSLLALVAAALMQPRLLVALGLGLEGPAVLRGLLASAAAYAGARLAARSLGRAPGRAARALSAVALLLAALTVLAVAGALAVEIGLYAVLSRINGDD